MKPNTIGILSIITLAFSILWLLFLVWNMLESGPLKTFAQVLSFVTERDWKYVFTYVNATLITICTSMLFAGLFSLLKTKYPLWAAIGIVFVPVYCALNVVVYLSQITVVPVLVEMQTTAAYGPIVEILLKQWLQQWQGSAIAFINLTAYAVLGIPSIIYGSFFLTGRGGLRYGGLFLALNGASCIIGLIGLVIHNKIMEFGSIIGGVLFIVALIIISFVFMGKRVYDFK